MGEGKKKPMRRQFNRRVKLEFRGAKVTSDAGLQAHRELDEQLGLSTIAATKLVDSPSG